MSENLKKSLAKIDRFENLVANILTNLTQPTSSIQEIQHFSSQVDHKIIKSLNLVLFQGIEWFDI